MVVDYMLVNSMSLQLHWFIFGIGKNFVVLFFLVYFLIFCKKYFFFIVRRVLETICPREHIDIAPDFIHAS